MGRQRSTTPRVKVLWVKRRGSFYLRYREPGTDRWLERSAETAVRREADRAAARLEDDLLNRSRLHLGGMAWADFLVRFLSQHLPTLSPRTAPWYVTALHSYESIMRPAALNSISAASITAWLTKLRDGTRTESTIDGYLRHLRSAIRWAHRMGWLDQLPRFPAVARAKTGSRGRAMKGRPITDAEFAAILAKLPEVVGADRAGPWEFALRGLWWSGLRLDEAIGLSWDDPRSIRADMSPERPVLRIPSEAEKGRRDRVLPMAPEFAELLQGVPPEQRTGRVFAWPRQRNLTARPTLGWVSRQITELGQMAGVEVAPGKFASAHDFRRSFGTRWARRVLPQILQTLMRHESLETTLRYYVDLDADTTARDIWRAYDATRES